MEVWRVRAYEPKVNFMRIPLRSLPPGASPLPHHRFLSLSVKGGKFLDGFSWSLSRGVNNLVGGTGSGKTTLLELLAFAAQPSGTPPSAHVRDNLGSGTVTVEIETAHGARYTIERTTSGSCTTKDSGGREVDAAPAQLIPVDYFRVREIEQTGKDRASKLRLIDGFIAEEIREFDLKVASLGRAIEAGAKEEARLLSLEREQKDDAAAVGVLEEKLKALAAASPGGADLAPAAAAAGLRQQERQALLSGQQALSKTREDAGRFEAAISRKFASPVDDALLAGPNAEVMARVAAALATARTAMTAGLAAVVAACETGEAALRDRERTLNARHQEQDAAYQKVLAQVKEEAGRAAERADLQKRLAKALDAKKHVDQIQAELRALDLTQRKHLEALQALYDGRYKQRTAACANLSTPLAPSVRVTIQAGKGKELFRERLTERLRNSKMKYAALADKIVDVYNPHDFVEDVRRHAAGRIVERAGIDAERAAKVIDHLDDPETLYGLALTELADEPHIEILDGEYKDTANVSTGQRCTAVLPIVLLGTERPLLIDQPEDDIEGAFLVETIIKSIRAVKPHRQLIFATHDPNIVVLSDSEQVTILSSDGTRSKAVASGTVDEVKEHIQALLEGGAAAFAERMKRYGY